MKTFIEVVADYLKTATVQEVLQIRTVLDKLEGRTSAVIEAPLLTDTKNYFINNNYNGLMTVKYLRDRTGWDIKTCKDWFEDYVKIIKPSSRY